MELVAVDTKECQDSTLKAVDMVAMEETEALAATVAKVGLCKSP